MPSITFHGSSVPRIDSSSGVSCEKTLRTVERKTFWPLSCFDQPIVRALRDAGTWKNLQTGTRNGPSHDTVQSAFVHETLSLQLILFFSRAVSSPSFISAKIGLGVPEKLVIKSSEEENHSKYIVALLSLSVNISCERIETRKIKLLKIKLFYHVSNLKNRKILII